MKPIEAIKLAAKIKRKSKKILKSLCPKCQKISAKCVLMKKESEALDQYCEECRTKVQKLMEVFK